MRRRTLLSATVSVASLLLAPLGLSAPKASASASASAPAPHPPLPAGHPPMDGDDVPPGHPPRGRTDRELRVNDADVDPSLPRGTIVVELRGPDDKPIQGQEVTLGIVRNTIAEGESRKRRTAKTDDKGTVTFADNDVGSAFAYRASVTRDGALSAAMPFNLPEQGGMKVVLYAFPVVKDVDQAAVAVQGALYIELRDDVIVCDHAYRVLNAGATTWLAQGTEITLPAGHKAFNAQKAMSDLVWDATKAGAKLTGTVSPGVHETAFRYHVPMPDETGVTLDLGVFPHVQAYRVIVAAPKGMTLEIDGFPPAIPTTNQEGQPILFTERTMDRLDRGFRTLRVRLEGIPDRQHKDARLVATGIALAFLAAGGFALKSLAGQPRKRDRAEDEAARDALLDALVALEAAKERGDVGPKTYEADRRTLLDALARLLADAPELADPPPVDKDEDKGGTTRRKARRSSAGREPG